MINIYDFDKTIYDGDSSIDFFRYCTSKNKKCLLIIPNLIIAFIAYKLKIKEKEYLKSKFFSFVKYFLDINLEVEEFWRKNMHKIKNFYLKQRKETDIIVSASPEFLLESIAKKLNVKLVATKINIHTGKIIGKNCYGQEKVERLKKIGITKCYKCYSDSQSDLPIRKIANKGFIVKKNKIINWKI